MEGNLSVYEQLKLEVKKKRELDKFRNIYIELKQKYSLDFDSLIGEIINNELLIPLDIFIKEFSPLETIIKYLVENQKNP